jgi:membrane fusion protein, multidrug efflux system
VWILFDFATAKLRRRAAAPVLTEATGPVKRLMLAGALLAALTVVNACSREAGGDPPASQRGAPGGTGGAGGSRGGGRPAAPVDVAVAERRRVEDAITGTGQIEPLQSIELRPEVEGRIVDILFREGSRTAAGAALFKVDDAELRVQVARATAERDLAQQELTRTRQLIQSSGATQSDLERAEAQMRGTQAALELLELRLQRTTVRAPFEGVLGARMVSLGDYVNSQTRLVSLQTWNPQRATLTVPERYAERLRLGQRISFTVAALRNRTFTGTVDFVDPVVRLPGRTILVKAVVPNARGELQAGMFVEGRLVVSVRENAVVVPEDAILPVQGASFVWVVADGKASRRAVETGVRTPGFVEITSGVEAGEHVVVGGLERLSEGMSVRPNMVQRNAAGASIAAPDSATRDTAARNR